MGMREDLEIPLTMLSIIFLDKLPYKGSYKGQRFLFVRVDGEEGKVNLKVYIWKDLFCFEKTDEKDMIIKTFDYNKEGIEQGIDFVEATKL